MTESLSDYVFKTISSPVVAEKKSRPNRAIICILGTMIGLMLGSLLAFSRSTETHLLDLEIIHHSNNG